MKPRFLLVLICLLSLAGPAVSGEKDVPRAAADEIFRRGEMVEHVGAIRGGIEDAVALALAPPADDSHKWFVTILSVPGCAACEKLRSDFSACDELRAFANPGDAKNSWSHFNFYLANDATQEWRFRSISKATYPILLIQPPRTKAFGEPATVVYQWQGYDGDAKKRAAEMRAAIVAYVRKTKSPAASAVAGGFGQGFGPSAPPFSPQPANPQPAVTPQTPPVNPFPFEFPPLTPSAPPGPAAATLEQLKAALPAADAEFLLLQLTAKASLEQAIANWDRAHPRQPTPATPLPEPRVVTVPTTVPALPDEQAATINLLKTVLAWAPTILTLFGTGNVAGLVGIGLVTLRAMRTARGKTPILNDSQFADAQAAVTAIVNQLLKTSQMPAAASDPQAATVKGLAGELLHNLIARLHGQPSATPTSAAA